MPIIMLPDYIKKVKSFGKNNQADLFVAALIVLVSITGFGLGRLSALWPKKTPITFEETKNLAGAGETRPDNQTKGPHQSRLPGQPNGKFVASKNGSSYHYPWCPGALKIKEENKLWFQTKEEAEKNGYKPAGNCPGL